MGHCGDQVPMDGSSDSEINGDKNYLFDCCLPEWSFCLRLGLASVFLNT